VRFVRYAVYAPPFGTVGDVNQLVELARTAELAGWDGFFLTAAHRAPEMM
jgi:alkanesulfonate monooxygenase SsuD/methylene tetrahydromethanopterin reductase-like flavin-dependent oxidoreductase (luciferase family)